jgi:hypothetical protein
VRLGKPVGGGSPPPPDVFAARYPCSTPPIDPHGDVATGLPDKRLQNIEEVIHDQFEQ